MRLVFPNPHAVEGHPATGIVALPRSTLCVNCLAWALLRQDSTSNATFACQ